MIVSSGQILQNDLKVVFFTSTYVFGGCNQIVLYPIHVSKWFNQARLKINCSYPGVGDRGGSPGNGLNREASPKKGYFFEASCI